MTSMIWLLAASAAAFPVARDANLVKKHRLGVVLVWEILNDTTGGNEDGIYIGWTSHTQLVMLV